MTELEVMKICCAAIGDNKCRTGSLAPRTDVLTAELPVLDPVMMVSVPNFSFLACLEVAEKFVVVEG